MGSDEKIAQAKALHTALAFKEQQVIEFLAELGRGAGAREIALVRTHLQDARHYAEDAWLELEKHAPDSQETQK